MKADSPETKAKHAKKAFEYMLKGIKVPMTLPDSPSGVKTGWEGQGIEEVLKAIAQLEGLPRDRRPLPPKSERGPDWDQDAYLAGEEPSTEEIIKAKQPQPIYSRPPASSTRQNPKTWTRPHTLSARFIRRTARRILESLPPKLSFVDGHWRAERVAGKGKGKGKRRKREKQGVEGKDQIKPPQQSSEAPKTG